MRPIHRAAVAAILVAFVAPSSGCLWYAMGKSAGKRDAQRSQQRAELEAEREKRRELERQLAEREAADLGDAQADGRP